MKICPHFTFPNLFPTVQHYSASRDARLNYFMFTIFILLPFSIFRTLSTIVLDFLLVILIFKPYIFLRTPQQIPSALEVISYFTSEIPPSSELPCPLYLFLYMIYIDQYFILLFLVFGGMFTSLVYTLCELLEEDCSSDLSLCASKHIVSSPW